VGRWGIAVVAVALVAAGCGAGSKRPATGTAGQKYTLQQVKAAFAAEGITLDKMSHTRHLVVLRRAGWFGPFGYQRTTGWSGVSGSYSLTRPSVTEFLVFVGSGPHYEQRRNVFVGYSAGERPTVAAALRQLARNAKQ